MKNIDIILSSDNNYAQYLGVVLCSIFENKKQGHSINVHVINGGISSENIKKLEILEERYNFNINYINIDKNYFSDLFISDHISQATYYRILIPSLLKNKINKVLYLDCDLIIQCDLLELFEINIDNYFVGAVEDDDSETKEVLGLSSSDSYFNAGVLLMNIEKWNNSNIAEETFEFIRNNPDKIKFWDQDALNYTLKNKWLIINKCFNLSAVEAKKISKDKSNTIINNSIIHFSGNLKPWNFAYNGFGKEIYKKYLKKTPWNGEKCKDINIKNLVKKILFILFPYEVIKKIVKIKNNFIG